MAVDIQVVFPQQIIDLSSVRILAGTPRHIEVTGADFRAVDEVRVNGVASPKIVVLSPTRLEAQVPDLLQDDTLTSVTVVGTTLVAGPKSLLRFRLGTVAAQSKGIVRLMQVFLKVLLTTPGRDIFAPELGGGALRNLGTTIGGDQGGAVISDVIVAVKSAERQLVAIQARERALPPAERLLSATVTSKGFDPEQSALMVSIELRSQAGEQALANLTV